jgi:hypothetical protein
VRTGRGRLGAQSTGLGETITDTEGCGNRVACEATQWPHPPNLTVGFAWT